MRDKRPVDELSIEELERILAIKRREARQQQLQRMKRDGRVVTNAPEPPTVATPPKPRANGAESPFALPQPPGTVNLPDDSGLQSTVAPAPETGEAPVDVTPEPATSRPAPRSVAPRFYDEPGDVGAVTSEKKNDQVWRSFINRSLLLVEVAAVIGLIFIGVNMVTAINTLDTETQEAQRMQNEASLAAIPTPEPTPTIKLANVVLPGGHVLLEGGGARFKEEEIPAHLRARVQNQIYQPIVEAPPPSDDTPLELLIPDLDLHEVINPGTNWETLRRGVGMHLNGDEPGETSANVVLAAHNDIYGKLFEHLPTLEVGARFQIRTRTAVYTYVVTGTQVVEPTDVHVMDTVPGMSIATLISCYPYGVNTHRWIVTAERVDITLLT